MRVVLFSKQSFNDLCYEDSDERWRSDSQNHKTEMDYPISLRPSVTNSSLFTENCFVSVHGIRLNGQRCKISHLIHSTEYPLKPIEIQAFYLIVSIDNIASCSFSMKFMKTIIKRNYFTVSFNIIIQKHLGI